MKKLLGIIALSTVFSIVLMGCKGAEEGDTAGGTAAPPATTGGKMEGTAPSTSTPATKPDSDGTGQTPASTTGK